MAEQIIIALILEALGRVARLKSAYDAAKKSDPTPEESALVNAVMEENRDELRRLTGH